MHYFSEMLLCTACLIYKIDDTKKATENCEYCGESTHPAKRREYMLMDDCATDTSKRDFRVMYFCYKHYPLDWVTFRSCFEKSTVMTGIRNEWGKPKDARGNIIEFGNTTRAGLFALPIAPAKPDENSNNMQIVPF
jgi:hypothetical protein